MKQMQIFVLGEYFLLTTLWLCLKQSIGATQWTNPSEFEIGIKMYHKNNKKMPLCQIIWLTRSHLPASKHQFIDDTKIKISSKNWYLFLWMQDDLAKWHFLLFLWYILIFWAQMCWFLELNLTLSSDSWELIANQ